MEVICIEDGAFYALIEQVVLHLQQQQGAPSDRWINDMEAKRLLNIKSKTTLQKLRDEGKIKFSQPSRKIILYDRESIDDYLEKYSRETF